MELRLFALTHQSVNWTIRRNDVNDVTHVTEPATVAHYHFKWNKRSLKKFYHCLGLTTVNEIT